MPQTGAVGARRIAREGDPPSRIVAFDPVGEIAVADRRAAERAAAAERFAATFGLDELAESAAAIADRWDVRYEPSDSGPAGRRTVTITGQGARPVLASRSASAAAGEDDPRSPAHDRARGHGRSRGRSSLAGRGGPGAGEFRGDRAALWAVGLGLLLILVAVASAHAAALGAVAAP